MKNKRVLYIFLILLIIVIIVLLSSVLFCINSATLSFTGTAIQTDTQKIQNELNSKAFNQNIFLINENKIISEIEKENPYIKVINIERIFPSSLKLHYTERKELYQLELNDNSYAVLDCYGKVLRISESITENVSLDFDYVNVNISDFLTDENIILATNVYKAFTMITEDEKQYNQELFKAYFKNISINNNVINLKTVFGAVISFEYDNNNLANLIYQGLEILESLNDLQRQTEIIYIEQ